MKCILSFLASAIALAASTLLANEGFYSVTRDADGIWWGVRPDGAKFVPNAAKAPSPAATAHATALRNAFSVAMDFTFL